MTERSSDRERTIGAAADLTFYLSPNRGLFIRPAVGLSSYRLRTTVSQGQLTGWGPSVGVTLGGRVDVFREVALIPTIAIEVQSIGGLRYGAWGTFIPTGGGANNLMQRPSRGYGLAELRFGLGIGY